MERIGDIGRVIANQQTPNYTLAPYVVQALLLLVAPSLFAVSINMELGRIILLIDGGKYSPIKRKWLTKLFVMGDVLSFVLPSGGEYKVIRAVAPSLKNIARIGVISSMTSNGFVMGERVIVVELFVPVALFGLFIVVALVLHYRVHLFPTRQSRSSASPSKRHLYAIYAPSLLIMFRSIFRVVEYIEGNDRYILRHGVFLYLFDGVFMLGVMVLFNIIHPSEVKALLRGGKV